MISAAVEKQAVLLCERCQGIWQLVQGLQNSFAPERVLFCVLTKSRDAQCGCVI